MTPFVNMRRQGEFDYLFGSADAGECSGTLLLCVVLIHGYGKLFSYSSSTEVIPAYLSLVVNCFVFRSMDIG